MINNHINTYQTLTEYNNDQTHMYPNISYIVATDEVKWQATEPRDAVHLVCIYDINDTANATKLWDTNNYIDYMIIDGERQTNPVQNYTFSTTGEHTVKYKLTGNQLNNAFFKGCTRLVSVSFPDNLTGIEDGSSLNSYGAFYGCTNLSTVYVNSGFKVFGLAGFKGCTSLANIVMPDSVTQIRNNAFDGCTSLASVTINATTPPTLNNTNAFNNNASGRKFYVPAASVTAYQTASQWSTYSSSIEAIS